MPGWNKKVQSSNKKADDFIEKYYELCNEDRSSSIVLHSSVGEMPKTERTVN